MYPVSLLGAMERQLETSIRYANKRRLLKKPNGKFQSIANRIVDMKVGLESSRFILNKVGCG